MTDKLLQLISDVRALRAVIIALTSALITGAGLTVQRGYGTAEGHAAIITRITSVADSLRTIRADVDSLKTWRAGVSQVQTFLACRAIAINDGLDPAPCVILCPPQVRRDIRELLERSAK